MSALRTLAAIGNGLLSGSLLTEAAVLVPYWRSISPQSFSEPHEGVAPRLFRYFAPLTVGAALLAAAPGVVAATAAPRDPTDWLTISSSALAVSLLGFYKAYFESANRRLPELATLAAPTELTEELRRWQLVHAIRTAVCLASFALAVAAL